MTDPPRVAVIGAGFSGLLTALRLLLPGPEGPRVVLIERGPRFGRGAAYSTASPHHLLNVRATNMSALVEQPSHFIDWLGAEGVATPDQVFVTRDRYGQYLQSLLREATSDNGSGRLVLEHDEVRTLEREGDRWRLGLAMGRTIIADAVVLALGNLAPPPPDGAEPDVLTSEAYVGDPWRWRGPEGPVRGDVLLIGSGLTAVDVALTIHDKQPDARMLALSRHGLQPRSHGEARSMLARGAPSGSPSEVLSEVRRRTAADWRGGVDSLRPHVQTIWRQWSAAERRSALRHLRPWWNVHRHRLAPEIAERLADYERNGLFSLTAGRLQSLRLADGGIEATWRPRGARETETRLFARVVNCMGPSGDISQSDDPLIASILEAGLIRPDDCALGVDVDARSRAVGASGEAIDGLFAVGPLTRGQFYEITSVPDIRLQAADCADSILNMLALKGRTHADGAGDTSSAERLTKELTEFIEQSMAELDVELGSLKFARRVRGAWELRGRRAALGEIALWLEERRGKS